MALLCQGKTNPIERKRFFISAFSNNVLTK